MALGGVGVGRGTPGIPKVREKGIRDGARAVPTLPKSWQEQGAPEQQEELLKTMESNPAQND